jgi:hypothetical protein
LGYGLQANALAHDLITTSDLSAQGQCRGIGYPDLR